MTNTESSISLNDLAEELDVDPDALDRDAHAVLDLDAPGAYVDREFTAEGADIMRAGAAASDSGLNLQRIEDAVRRMGDAEDERDAAIRDAFRAGSPRADIAAAAGLSRARIYQIVG